MPPKAIILLVHGLGARQERWVFLTKYFTKYNIRCSAVDIGPEVPLHQWFTHLAVLHSTLTKKYPQTPLYICGESLGGLMAYRYALKKPKAFPNLSGLILISPAFQSSLRFSLPEYISIITGLFLPKIHVKAHFTAAMCTSDTKYQDIMKKNKKETRNFPTRLYLEIAWQQILARLQPAPKTKTLFLLAGEDVMVNTNTNIAIARKNKFSYKIYAGMRHAISIETQRNTVFHDIVTWIQGV
jgi:alpha-beta hydrolase superfamily lysophospholipase